MKASTILALGALAGVAAIAYYIVNKIGAGALNPANPNNIVNQGATSVVQQITGDQNQTPGGWLHDIFNPDAGLAPGETVIAPGIIRTPIPSSTGTAAPSASASTVYPPVVAF